MKKFFENSIFLLSVRILTKLITVFVFAVIARKFGVDNFGLYSAILALTSITGYISDFGLITPSIRAISNHEETISSTLIKTFEVKIFYGLIGLCIITFIGYSLNYSFELILFFSFSSILELTASNLIRYYEGVQDFKKLSKFQIFERICYLISTLVPLYFFNSIKSLAISSIISYTIFIFFLIKILKDKENSKIIYFNKLNILKYSKSGLPFFLMILASNLFYKSDIIIINNLLSLKESGIYNSVIKIFESQTFIPMTMVTTLFPFFVKTFKFEGENFKKNVYKYLLIFLIASILVTIFVYVFAEIIINILYSKAFGESATLLKYFSFIFIFNYLNTFLGFVLFSAHKEKVYTIVLIIITFFTIIFNLVFVKQYGIFASFYIRLISEVGLLVILFLILLKNNFYINEIEYNES